MDDSDERKADKAELLELRGKVSQLEAALAQANQLVAQLRARLYGVLLLIRE